MIKNYITTAYRNFIRNKTFSLINVLGLAIGISAALVIYLIVMYEFGFDTFEKNGDRIYRVVIDAKFNGTEGHSSAIPGPLSAAVAAEMTGIEHTVPFMTYQNDGTAKVSVARTDANPLIIKKQASIAYTNPAYFRMINYQWLAGNQELSLKEPFSVVLTTTRAAQYFPGIPTADIIGRTVTYDNSVSCKVTGIVANIKDQTLFNQEEFISYATIEKSNLKNNFMLEEWNDWMAYNGLYLQLAKGTAIASTELQLNELEKKYNKAAIRNPNNSFSFRLLPLADMHFNNLYQMFGQRVANKKTLYGLLSIAAFLLLLGCINFVNLTTAQAVKRAKEIGIRKTLGSSKKQLLLQFLGETFFITAIATLLSIVLSPVLLSMFRNFIPNGLQVNFLLQPGILLFLFLLMVVVSFLAGIYPALVLSGYKPALVLKNQVIAAGKQTRKAWVRQSLTVAQFVIAQFFIIAVLFVNKQINFGLHSDLGFNKEAVINFDIPRDTVASHVPLLLQQIKQVPGVAMVASGFMAPADDGVAYTSIALATDTGDFRPAMEIQYRMGNPEYLGLYQLTLLAGRAPAPSDTIKEFLINDTYARALGFQQPAAAIGKFLKFNNRKFPIVGVLKDFHDSGMKSKISGLVFGAGNGGTFHIKLKPNSADGKAWTTTLSQLQLCYNKLYPDADFEYRFVDDVVGRYYETEKQTASLLGWATGLTILISCLGLLGLVIYTTNMRIKEIGIRKILGASISNIIAILSKDFIKPVWIGFLIAAPLAWWATNKWLEDYAYKTEMSWWVFGISGLSMLLLSMLTLSVQTLKTAMGNPVKNLRTE